MALRLDECENPLIRPKQKQELQHQLQQHGWEVIHQQSTDLEWWASEVWTVQSVWSPHGVRVFITFLVDPMSETGETWAVDASLAGPAMNAMGSGVVRIDGRTWKHDLPTFLSALDGFRDQTQELERATQSKGQAMDVWEQHKQRLRDILVRDYRASLMNTTKWEEVKDLLKRLQLDGRVKLITDQKPIDWRRSSVWAPRGFLHVPGGPVHVLAVEWMEVEPVYQLARPYVGPDRFEDRTAELEQGLRMISAPFSREDRVYRIWGHVPADNYPAFVR